MHGSAHFPSDCLDAIQRTRTKLHLKSWHNNNAGELKIVHTHAKLWLVLYPFVLLHSYNSLKDLLHILYFLSSSAFISSFYNLTANLLFISSIYILAGLEFGLKLLTSLATCVRRFSCSVWLQVKFLLREINTSKASLMHLWSFCHLNGLETQWSSQIFGKVIFPKLNCTSKKIKLSL